MAWYVFIVKIHLLSFLLEVWGSMNKTGKIVDHMGLIF